MNSKRQSDKLGIVTTWAAESGIVLIAVLALVAILALVGTVAVITTNTDIKISGNYKSSVQAFYVAEAGIERAKGVLKTNSFDNILNGTHGGSPGILNFGTSTSFAGGTYTVRVFDDDDGDGNILNDSNGKVKIIGTGTVSTGSTRSIEIVVSQFPLTDLPASVSFIDNNNGDTDEDEIRAGGTGTILITGFDTLDGSTSEGDGPGPDKPGLVSQEAFETDVGAGGGAVDDPATLASVGILKGSSTAYASGGSVGGPNEATVKSQVDFYEKNADILITVNKLSQTPYTTFGTASDPQITHIADNFEIDGNITGYGNMIVEGRLELKAGSRLEFHGVIYIVCRGQYVQDTNPSGNLVVWGAILMITYDETGCTSISGEERMEIKKGNASIYYSTDAINKYAAPLTFSIVSWREVY